MAERPLNICVLGGTGFVGTELVVRLANEGHSVRVPTRRLANGGHLRVLPTVQLVIGNVHSPLVLGQLFAGVDVVVNLVGILNEHGRSTFRSVHTDLATRVVEAMRAQRVPRLLHMSSLGAGAHAPSQYLRSKADAEAQVRVAAATVESTIFRPSVIFGPRDSLTNFKTLCCGASRKQRTTRNPLQKLTLGHGLRRTRSSPKGSGTPLMRQSGCCWTRDACASLGHACPM